MANAILERNNKHKDIVEIICTRCGSYITACRKDQIPKRIKCMMCETKYGSKFVGKMKSTNKR